MQKHVLVLYMALGETIYWFLDVEHLLSEEMPIPVTGKTYILQCQGLMISFCEVMKSFVMHINKVEINYRQIKNLVETAIKNYHLLSSLNCNNKFYHLT